MIKIVRGLIGLTVAGLLFLSCHSNVKEANYDIIPLPKSVSLDKTQSPFVLDKDTKIFYPGDNALLKKNAEFLSQYINEQTGMKLSVIPASEGKGILLKLGQPTDNEEGYEMEVSDKGVVITGNSEAGVFYGIQSLRKSLPIGGTTIHLPAVTVKDYPRFAYRGTMLDVSRHFFPVDSIKHFIDILAMHNINRFHWHLSEDQGWRIEIKSRPRLTEVGSKRTETVVGRNSGKYDGIPYSGFYTQDEAREIVAYAADRHITVIPEIDMPGHMLGALASYPELGCTGGPYQVWRQWGVSDDVLCAGNDATLQFIDDVLAEIVDIFPSEYIHVGGDECPKTRWKTCPKCQARIRQLGIKSDKNHTAEEYLQSFIINHAEKFLNSRGRQMIGWDETLEGGLAPNATVMSWRGEKGGIEAARQRHNVIMTPNTYVYFDYYQTKDIEQEPLAIGGYLPVENVYNYEPMPSVLTPDEQKYIIGVQANIWTEYMPSFAQVQYMLLPRVAALSEVQWSAADQKNFQDFETRLPRLVALYDVYHFNYATHAFDIKGEIVPDTGNEQLDVTFSTIDNSPIHYTLDGTEPTAASPRYEAPLHIKQSCTVKAVGLRAAGNTRIFSEDIAIHKASFKPITALQPVNKQYRFGGESTLVDGMKGNFNYKTGKWIAFYKNDMEMIIDFKQPTSISSVAISALVEIGDWVMDARHFSVAISEDGKNFKQIAAEDYPAMKESDPNKIYHHKLSFDAVSTRYIKVIAKPEYKMPKWHGGHGYPAFLFVDEITVE